LAFELLETMDLPFHLSLAPIVVEIAQDSRLVAPDALGKGA
jgi:hypothetical protein